MPTPLTTMSPSGLPRVRFQLECAEVSWFVHRLEVSEGISETYRGVVVASCASNDEPNALVGRELALTISRGDHERLFAGIVTRVVALSSTDARVRLELSFVPALALLERERVSRIFQHLTVPEVLEAVIGPTLTNYERGWDLSGVASRSFLPRDFCVQYRETSAAFVHRLLNEEGISYRFEHDERGREMAIFVDRDAGTAIEVWGGGNEVNLAPNWEDHTLGAETIREVARVQTPSTPAIVHGHWDWRANPAAVFESTAGETDAGVAEFGGRRLAELDATGIVVRAREALETNEVKLHGTSNVIAFSPYARFELNDSDHDGKYLIATASHRGEAPDEHGEEAATTYRNDFACVPQSDHYRRPPTATAKPLINGPQTAVVVGPPNEEIHTDEFGRIQVRFHWDRNPSPSCWVRVAQLSAGMGLGSMFIPRVGMEVVISFLDGDPDRPLCTGCVYNGQHPPPYKLPDQRTKSGIRTQSSPGGRGANELCFEDEAGQEQLLVKAQRDYREVVGHDRVVAVENDENMSVGGRRSLAVEGNHLVTVEGKGKEGEPLSSPHFGVEVDGDYRLQAEATVTVEAKKRISLKCGSTLVELTPTTITLRAGDGAAVVLDVAALMTSKPGASVLLDDKGGVTAASTGVAKIAMDKRIVATSSAGARVVLADHAEIGAPQAGDVAGASLKLTTNAELHGHMTTISGAAASAVMSTDMTLKGACVEISGDQFTCSAVELVRLTAATVQGAGATQLTLTAPLVKIN